SSTQVFGLPRLVCWIHSLVNLDQGSRAANPAHVIWEDASLSAASGTRRIATRQPEGLHSCQTARARYGGPSNIWRLHHDPNATPWLSVVHADRSVCVLSVSRTRPG